MRQLWRLRRYFWRYKWAFFIGLLFLIAVDYIQLIPPKIIGEAVDKLGETTPDAELPALLVKMALMIAALWAGVVVTRFFWRFFIIGASLKIERDLRDDYYNHVIKLPAPFFNRRRTGDLMALATNDIVSIRSAMGDGFVIFMDVFIMSILTLSMMLEINPEVTLYAFIPLPLVSIMFFIFGPIIHRLFLRVQTSFADLTTRVEENASGTAVVRAYVQEEGEKNRFETANNDLRDKTLRFVLIDGSFHASMVLLPSLGFVILLMCGGSAVLRGEMTLGDFIAMNIYIGVLVWPMMAMGWVFNLFQRAGASIKRLYEVMDEKKEDRGGKCDFVIGPPVEIKNLTFTYPDACVPALQDVSISIPEGRTIAIMGRTGSGKSTLVNVLTRLYDPPRRTVFLSGRDILDIPREAIRNQFGVAPQEAFLFSDSIRRNIAFAKPGIAEAEIMRVAKTAHIHQDVMNFPDRFDTVIGERGVTLSGGQRQRTSIARAFLAGRNIIILDDPLSAVDTITEAGILESLRAEKSGKTLVMITNRVNAAAIADRIYVLDHGRVIEEGTESELLAKGGLFKTIYEIQKYEERIEK
jgi:ATP-binding cassette subfamily B protein